MKRDCRVKLGNNGPGGSRKDGTGGSGSHDQSAIKGQFTIDLVSSVPNIVSPTPEVSFVQEADPDSWWLDTCSTHHVCNDERWFTKLNIVNKGSVLRMADEGSKPILGTGVVNITFTSGKTISLFDVLYVPKVRKNLVSSGLLNCMGFKQVIESNKFVLSKCGIFVGFGYYCERVFKLNVVNCFASLDKSVFMTSAPNLDNSMLWHNRLGHVHIKRMIEMSKSGLIPAFDINSEKCKTCMLTKITKQPFPNVNRKSDVLELIHSDLCDFHATPSLGNKKYIVTFIDDSSRFCYVYLLHSKDEALEKFKIYKTEVELQLGISIKCLRTDRGGEYMDSQYFQSVGIIHETTAPYNPQQNGVAERKNRV